jgi:hypothetical protein
MRSTGVLFCALNAGAGTARGWRSPRSNWESEEEKRRTLSHAESTHRERERERDDGSLRASRDCGHAAKERKQVGGERIRGD